MDTADQARTAPAIVDHPIKGSLAGSGVRMGFVFGTVGLFFFLIFLSVAATAGFGLPRWAGTAILISGIAVVIGVGHRRSIGKIRSRLNRSTPEEEPAAILADLIGSSGGTSAVQAVGEITKSLAKQDRRGTTIRICPAAMADAVEPINVPFEPLPLENLDAALADAGAQEAPAINDDGPALLRSTEPSEGWRYVRRNIAIKGGWFIVAVFGFNTVLSALEAYSAGRFTARLGMWTSFLLITLLWPAKYGRAGSGQWLVVPGGIVSRKAKWNSKIWTLHVFTRSEGVLCVYRASRESWGLVVADKDAFERAVATRSEVHALLRAWMSLLPPPAVERLTDLV